MPTMTSQRNQFDWSTLDIFDDIIENQICLTQRQVMVLKAALIPAYWKTRWIGLPDTDEARDELAAMIASIDSKLDGNDCDMATIDFRDNPSDPCEVQYSKDGGETWLTMFRKDNCRPGATSIDIDNIYIDIDNVTTNNTTWNNNIINVAPDWEYVDEYSDRALCWAIDFYVDMICDFAIAQIESHNEDIRDDNDWLDDLSEIIAGGVIAGVSATAGAVTLPAILIGAIIWGSTALTNALWDILITVSDSAFKDTEARQAVKCIMYQAQTGETPQYPAWRDSLEDWASLGGNAKSIGSSVHLWNSEVDVYINYMMLMEDINSISATLPACPCPERWLHHWDFVTHGMEAWVLGPPEYGVWTEGVGMVGEIRQPATYKNNIVQNIRLNESVPRCDAYKIHFSYTKGDWDIIGTAMEMYVPPRATETKNNGWLLPGATYWRYAFAIGPLTSVAMFMNVCKTELGSAGYLKVTGMTLEGEGVDPFYGRETS